MENDTTLTGQEVQNCAGGYSSFFSCLRLIAVMLFLCAATTLRVSAQQSEAIPQNGVTARYLGTVDPGSATPNGLSVHPLAITATPPAPAIISFSAAEVGVGAAAAQQLTASFSVSGYSGSFTPTATLHYGHDYTIGAVTCTASGASETCNATVTFQPSLPGARKDAIFLMDGTTRLATVLLGGVGQAPFSLLQPGGFTTSVPTNSYIYQSVVDENGVVYILPNGNTFYIESVTKGGVATQIPLTNPPYFWTIGIDGAGVLYLFNETSTVTTYDTVQGVQGTYQIPEDPPITPDSTTSWYPGAVGVDGSIYVVNQIRNNGVAYALRPNGTTAYADTFDPGVLQPFTAAADSAGDLFVGGYEIDKITPAGVQTQVNTVGASEGLAVDAADTLYATRYSPTDGVAELSKSDYSTPIASFGRSSPLGMSLGSDGTLYVSNYVNLDIFDRSSETIDFGEVDAGSSQTNSTASVYNGGNEPLTILAFTLSELSDAGFSLDSSGANECTFNIVLAPGTLCQVSVVFAPTHPGKFSGAISISSNSLNGNGTNSPQTIQLAGTTDGSYDVLSPSPLVFAAQAPGTSNTLAVTMTNEGNFYASTVYSVATDNPAFTLTQGTCLGVAVQVGASCQFQVTFSPTAAQAYTGTATIVTYVSGTGQPFQTITLPLSGSGVNPPAATPVIAPGTGTYTSSQQVTITDTTPNATIFYTTDSSVPSSNSTKYIGAITVNANETVNAIATATGFSRSTTASATFTFHEAVATATPTSLPFGNQVQGIASIVQTVTLKNTGIGTLTLTGFPITGSADFSQTNNCAGSLTAGSSCTLSIVYTPTSLGDKTATLTVNSDSIKAAPTVTLTGTGIVQPPVLTISPASLDFGNQIVNISVPQSVTVTNISKTDTVVLGGVFTTSSVALTASSPSCSSPLAPGMSCTVSVVFSPSVIQAFSGTVTLQPQPSGCGGCTRNYPAQTIAITGAGIAQPPVLTISPATLAFGNQIVNTSSAPQSVTVTNISKTDTVVLGGVFTTSSVALTASSPSCSSPLAPGMSCTVSVVFSPSVIQAFSGTVTLQPQPSGCGGCTRNYPAQTIAITGAGIAQPPVLTISPATLAFGNQIVNTSSAPQSVTVTNISTTDTVVVGSIAIGGSGFLIQPSSCSSPIAPGASCTIPFIFTPGATQAYSGTVTIQPQPSGCGGCLRSYPAQTFTVTGTGAAPVASLSPSTLSFSAAAGTTSAAQTVTLSNTGSVPLAITGITAPSSPLMGLFNETSNCGASLPAGASCTISVTFAPVTTGSVTGNILVADNATGSPQIMSLSGTGTPAPLPIASLSPSSLSFSATVGTTSAAQTVTLSNTGKAPLAISGITAPSSPLMGVFNETSNCGASLAAGASCAISVTFSPATTGSVTGNILVADNATGSPQTMSLSGTGTAAPLPVASLSPSSLSFSATVGTTSAAQTVTLSNTGKAPLAITGISAPSSPLMGLFNETSNCGASLPAGASCTISVTFTPATTGSFTGNILVTDNATGSPQTMSLSGTGTPAPLPIASLSPSSLSFSATAGTTSAAQTVTLSNTGKAPLTITGITAPSSPLMGLFNETSNCGASLAAGAGCAISVTFTPATTGSFTGSILVTDNATGSPQTISLSGTGTAAPLPVASLSPSSLSFSATAGTTSAAQMITLSNTGSVPLTITGITALSSPLMGQFTETSNCGASLAAGAGCAISVTFIPATTGSFTGSILVTDNATGSPQTISLSGTGTAAPLPVASLSPSSLSFSATAGTTSAAQMVTLNNTSSVPLTITGITALSSPLMGQFTETSNCGASLAAGAGCVISVTFAPATTGSFTGNVLITDDSADSPQIINLTGTGITTPDFVVASTTPPQSVAPGGSAQFSLTVTATNGATIPAVTLTATGLPPGATAAFSQSTVTPGSTSATSTLTIKTASAAVASSSSPWPSAIPALALIGWFFIPGKRRRRLSTLGVLFLASLGSLTFLGGCGAYFAGYSTVAPKSYTVTITATIGEVQQTATVQLTVN